MLDSRELEEEALLAALMGISEMMGDLSELDELLDAIVRIAPRLVSVDRCAIFLRNPRASEYRAAHAFSPDASSTALLLRLTIPEADMEKLIHKLVRQKLPVLMREGREPSLPRPIVEAFRIRSMLLVPLTYQEQVMGFMCLDKAGLDHLFTSREVNVVNAIASHAAVAIVHNRLVDAFRLERRRSDAMAGALCDGVIAIDANLRIASLNRGAEALLGWPTETVEGRLAGEVFGEEATEPARRILAGNARDAGVAALRAKDGSKVACFVTAVPVPAPAGGIAELLYALRRVDDPTSERPERTGEG